MARWDWLIVGAGFTGAVLAERIATQLDQSVLVIDRRGHIAGNAYDYPENGLLVHRYGPHIFHTNSDRVWSYLSRFTAWRPYFHQVLGMVDGRPVPVPFNLNSILALFPPRMADRLCETLIERFGFGQKVPILKLRTEADCRSSLPRRLRLRERFRGLHAQAVGHAAGGTQPERHGAGAGVRQPRRPVFPGPLSGDAAGWLYRAVRAPAGSSAHQRRIERRVQGRAVGRAARPHHIYRTDR